MYPANNINRLTWNCRDDPFFLNSRLTEFLPACCPRLPLLPIAISLRQQSFRLSVPGMIRFTAMVSGIIQFPVLLCPSDLSYTIPSSLSRFGRYTSVTKSRPFPAKACCSAFLPISSWSWICSFQ